MELLIRWKIISNKPKNIFGCGQLFWVTKQPPAPLGAFLKNRLKIIMSKKLFIPVIVGTARKGRTSGKVADFVVKAIESEYGDQVETTLIDPCDFGFVPGAEQVMTREDYQNLIQKADGIYIVTPEYNHSFPGELKMLLDMELGNYKHKAVGMSAISSGPWGGTRVIESLLSILRKVGLVIADTDYLVNFSGEEFPKEGGVKDPEAQLRRFQRSFDEVVWLAKVLREGRGG
jgi:NAD(P)H-dependent FMN reductase